MIHHIVITTLPAGKVSIQIRSTTTDYVPTAEQVRTLLTQAMSMLGEANKSNT